MISGWFLWALGALAAWGLWAVLSRFLGEGISGEHTQALSTVGMVPVLLAAAFLREARGVGVRRSPRGLMMALTSGWVSCAGNIAYFHALASGEKAATVIPLTSLYPLVTIVCGVLFLRERLNWLHAGGVAASIAAIYLFSVQQDGGFDLSKLGFVLWPVLLWGLSGFMQKLATNELPPLTAATWYLASYVPVAVFILVWKPVANWPSARDWSLLAAIGFCLACGNFAILAAYARHGKTSVIAPLGALYPLVSIPLAVLLLGERATPREIAAIALALISVAALSVEPAADRTSESPRKL